MPAALRPLQKPSQLGWLQGGPNTGLGVSNVGQIWLKRWPALGAKLGQISVPKVGTKSGAKSGTSIICSIGGPKVGTVFGAISGTQKCYILGVWRCRNMQKSGLSLTHWPPGAITRWRRGWLSQHALARDEVPYMAANHKLMCVWQGLPRERFAQSMAVARRDQKFVADQTHFFRGASCGRNRAHWKRTYMHNFLT